MSQTKRIIVLDIGTHKAQEARLLKDESFAFSMHMFFELFKAYKWRPLSTFLEYRGIQELRKKVRKFDFTFCFIEPVLYAETLNCLRYMGNFVYLNGVCSARASESATLLLAEKSLGNSIIKSKPNLSGEQRATWNFNFQNVIKWCNENLRKSKDDLFILRMNAEGVEKEIIEALYALSPEQRQVNAIYGSLGDIKKCFGAAEVDNALLLLKEMDIPYIYFTSVSTSWKPALKHLYDFCEKC